MTEEGGGSDRRRYLFAFVSLFGSDDGKNIKKSGCFSSQNLCILREG